MPEELEIAQPRSMELMERAQIDMQIATAKKYPRDLAKVKKRMMDFATLDEDTAESCFYTLKRRDKNGSEKTIQGPSVRLAEIAVACYQNVKSAGRLIDNDGRTVTAQGVCYDLENNNCVSMESSRSILTSGGKPFSADMQVVAGNAAIAIAWRNSVFKVVPKALVMPVYEAAKRVAVGNASTLPTRRDKILKRLAAMEVTVDRVLLKLDKSSVENIGLDDLETLIGLGTAIVEGETTVDEAFPTPQASHEAAQKLAIEKISKASGYTVEQVAACIDEKNVNEALHSRFGDPPQEKPSDSHSDGKQPAGEPKPIEVTIPIRERKQPSFFGRKESK